jgi:hypothetical protein
MEANSRPHVRPYAVALAAMWRDSGNTCGHPSRRSQGRLQLSVVTRTGLSAVTLEPLRPRATHVVQLRSIAAVPQGAFDGPENGPIHRLFPTPVSRAGYRPNFGQRMDVVGQ